MLSNEELKTKFEEFRQKECESEVLEFKEAKNDFNFDKLGQYFSALSNEANLKSLSSAWLIFGVKNAHPRDIVASNYRSDRASLESLKREVAVQTNGLTFQEIYELNLDAGRVIMFQIPAAPAGIPTSWKGHFFGRDGESLGALSIQEIEQIRNQATQPDWSAVVCDDAGLSDLDDRAVKLARDRFAAKHADSQFSEEIGKWDTATFLDKAKITRDGQITRAAILLLGKPESAHHVNPHPAQLTWKLETEEEAYEHFGPPFLLSTEGVFKRIRNIRFKLQPFNQLMPIELTKYDSKTILEALNNCIAHQDYSQNARVIIVERVDRIILTSFGSFYDGTIEDYVLRGKTPGKYRNQFLAQAMVNLDMIDTMGMGIKRMFAEQRRRFFPLPEYDLEDSSQVRITIYGKIIDENYSRILMERENLSLSNVINLDRVQKGHQISKEAAAALRRERLIEGRYPNVFVSSKIAAATEDKAQYIKNRAFDDEHYEKLILEFIDKYGAATRKDIDSLILNKLPDVLSGTQKKNKVMNLLAKMRRGGKIRNKGSAGSPKWVRIR